MLTYKEVQKLFKKQEDESYAEVRAFIKSIEEIIDKKLIACVSEGSNICVITFDTHNMTPYIKRNYQDYVKKILSKNGFSIYYWRSASRNSSERDLEIRIYEK